MKSVLLMLCMLCTVSFAVEFQCAPNGGYEPVLKKRNTYPTKNESLVHMYSACGGGCSGAIIGKDLVLTAAHCTLDAPYEFIRYSDNSVSLGIVIATGHYTGNPNEDWSLLKTDTGNRKTLKLACSVSFPSYGIDLTCGGRDWPDQQTYPVVFVQFERYSILDQDSFSLKFLGPADHGDSGSVVLNSKGQIVGVVSELDLSDPNIGRAVPLYNLINGLKPFIKGLCP